MTGYLDPSALPLLVVLLIDALACYRLSRLVTRDELTRPLRERLDARVEGTRAAPLAYLAECPWCASPYIAAGVLLARALTPLPWHLLALALTFSALAGVLSERE